MTIHWFFSLGVNPQPAVYYRTSTTAPYAERRFVTTALLDMEWPVRREQRSDVVLHLLPTRELRDEGRGSTCRHCNGEIYPRSPSPLDLFRAELASVDQGMLDRMVPHADLEKRDKDAIWQVVRTVLENVRDDDEVVLETTNGIRSIVAGFLLASGLLVAYRKNVRVLGVTYAEFAAEPLPPEVRSEAIKRGSPVVDLLPFLKLFDWSHAVRAMSQYHAGAVTRLASRLPVQFSSALPRAALAAEGT